MRNSKHKGALFGIMATLLLLGILAAFAAERVFVPDGTPQTAAPGISLADGQRYVFGVFRAASAVGGLKTFASDSLGISLKYPTGYSLFENEGEVGGMTFRSVVIALDEPAREAIARAQAGLPGEGPESIVITFVNDPRSLSLEEWIKSANNPYANYNSADPANALTPAQVSGVPALKYHTDLGLYASEYVVFRKGDEIVIAYAPSDLQPEFEALLASIRLDA